MPTIKKGHSFRSLDPIKPSVAYDTYWKFAYKRQKVFLNRLRGQHDEPTSDAVIQKYKFTNVYRACDRVSQYLIKSIIYQERFDTRDQILRILLFKLFNKIDTWELLQDKFGTISEESFSAKHYGAFLDAEMNQGKALYSNAYMMASGCKKYAVPRKHQAHLLLLEDMLKDDLPQKIEDCKSMKEAYELLLAYPLIGKFLAYQYVTDINYSEITNFSETEFTMPGPGARDGIRKCFSSLGDFTESELIKILTERQQYEFQRLGLNFETLGGRPLQYIDIQNVFCETDKYCRIVHPEVQGISGRSKIKQVFKRNNDQIEYYFPPKWDIDMEALYGRKHLSDGSC